ncbi:unnamed protein product [Zymoseptoria tritici ST99CH_1A5]|uniref:F-box domain-containing protein n=1 Tax=Zymoseptoria tritici ST99CH_1A5 TaxID=1276529 RepID=A0A1Y6LYZ5_ZYMTR|nr:unnamed protein product [Zymoseptoria tritici ST99CH_1A5]
MAMLRLPRELFLEVCAHLSTTELIAVAGASRDHYLAVQGPLYANIVIKPSGEYAGRNINPSGRLVKLVGSLNRRPIVSPLTPSHELNWQWLKDETQRQREIRHLKVVFNFEEEVDLSVALLSHCIAAIPTTTRSAPQISLVMFGAPWKLLAKLRHVALPHVYRLVLFAGNDEDSTLPIMFPSAKHLFSSKTYLWNLCLAGSTFPDLQELELDGLHEELDDVPKTLCDAHKEVTAWVNQHVPFSGEFDDCHYPFYGRPFDDRDPGGKLRSFHGLKKMTRMKLQYTPLLGAAAVRALSRSGFHESITSLEIINPPMLHQAMVDDLAALSGLLQRCSTHLQYLKLHLLPSFEIFAAEEGVSYGEHVAAHPEHHLCDIVRKMCSRMKTVDLALPYTCSRVFDSRQQTKQHNDEQTRTAPLMSLLPTNTLQRRLETAGYRYRRLICWDDDCFHRAGEWDTVRALASDQGEMISWEVIPNIEGENASWHLAGYHPVAFARGEVLARELVLDIP